MRYFHILLLSLYREAQIKHNLLLREISHYILTYILKQNSFQCSLQSTSTPDNGFVMCLSRLRFPSGDPQLITTVTECLQCWLWNSLLSSKVSSWFILETTTLNNGISRDVPIALQILVRDYLTLFLLQMCSLLNQKHRNRRWKHSFWMWIPGSHGKTFLFVLQMENRWRKGICLETRGARLVHGWNCSFSLSL